jgi:hypothetical protein
VHTRLSRNERLAIERLQQTIFGDCQGTPAAVFQDFPQGALNAKKKTEPGGKQRDKRSDVGRASLSVGIAAGEKPLKVQAGTQCWRHSSVAPQAQECQITLRTHG